VVEQASEATVDPWDAGEVSLSSLLGLIPGPGSDARACAWQLGRLADDHPEIRLAAWLIAETSMRLRCGLTPAYTVWREAVVSGEVLSQRDQRRVDVFLGGAFGSPSLPAPADHLEAHVAEVIWFVLTTEEEREHCVLRNSEGPSFSVTETGGDGLAIWECENGTLVFRLWEIKKHTAAAHISRTVTRACRQLSSRAEQYLAKYASVGSKQHSGDLGRLYALLPDLWIDGDERGGAGIAIATSRERAPVRRCFGTLVSTFPDLAATARLEGCVVAIGDFRGFAELVREYVWTGHSTSHD
jgi:hypothetical protein